MNCIFCKIINKELGAKRVYEDDDMIIINDINPQAKKHYLLIPKEHYANIEEMTDGQAMILGKCIKKLGTLSKVLGLENGYRIVSNKGFDACQSVPHLHIHVLGGDLLSEKMG